MTRSVESGGLPTGGLGRRAVHGVLVSSGARLLKIVVQVAAVVVLARLLTPGDYGLVAMVTAVIGLAEVLRDFGLSTAAIQAKTLSREQRDNLWWISTGIGALLAAIVCAGAPLVALWFRRPELVDLTRVLSLIFLLNGMTSQYRADLTRRLRFLPMAVWEVASPLVGLLLAIVLAIAGAQYWALAAQQLSAAAVLLIGMAVAARWLPHRPRRRQPMRALLVFGWQLVGSQLLDYLGKNIDSLVIGTRFGATPMGLYNRAYQLLMTPLGQVRAPTTTVALPVLARLHDDVEATNRYVQKGQAALGLGLVAGLGLIMGAAEPVTAIFLGAQWLSVEPLLRLLAIAGALHTLGYVAYWVYLAQGLTAMLFRYTLVTVSLKIGFVILGSQWGLIGVASGYALAVAIDWPLSFWWLARTSTVRVRPLFAGGARVLFITALIAGASWAACEITRGAGSAGQLAAAVLVGGVVFFGGCMALPSLRRELTGLIKVVRRVRRRS